MIESFEFKLGDKITKTAIGATYLIEFTKTIKGWILRDGTIVDNPEAYVKKFEEDYYKQVDQVKQ
jgi:hypothetical protein